MKSSRNSIIPTDDIQLARESGKILSEVLDSVVRGVQVGTTFEKLEEIAQTELRKRGATASFATVPGYRWATCITKNDGCCHGIPRGKTVEHDDIITIDVGALFKGYHTDTSLTVCADGCTPEKQHFLEVGQESLEKALQRVLPGNTVFHISRAMQEVVEAAGYRSIYQLTGHGIGKKLHQEPNIPCYADERTKNDILEEGQMLAVEIMYAQGDPTLVLDKDGWTYKTKDGSLTGMFEKTVIVTGKGPEVLTHFPLEKEKGI